MLFRKAVETDRKQLELYFSQDCFSTFVRLVDDGVLVRFKLFLFNLNTQVFKYIDDIVWSFIENFCQESGKMIVAGKTFLKKSSMNMYEYHRSNNTAIDALVIFTCSVTAGKIVYLSIHKNNKYTRIFFNGVCDRIIKFTLRISVHSVPYKEPRNTLQIIQMLLAYDCAGRIWCCDHKTLCGVRKKKRCSQRKLLVERADLKIRVGHWMLEAPSHNGPVVERICAFSLWRPHNGKALTTRRLQQ